MKMKLLLAVLLGALALTGRSSEPQIVAQIIANALKDPANAALVIEYGVEDNPRLLLQIVEAAVKALPEQAASIVGGLLKAVPKQQAEQLTEQQKQRHTEQQKEILKTAVQAAPDLAPKIAEVALTMFPAKAAVFLQTALEATPVAGRGAIVALGEKLALRNEPAGAPAPATTPPTPPSQAGAFPAQPIRPDLVSPSN